MMENIFECIVRVTSIEELSTGYRIGKGTVAYAYTVTVEGTDGTTDLSFVIPAKQCESYPVGRVFVLTLQQVVGEEQRT